jgi:glycosyltransferase involved in cell wall biosynthesis
MRIAVDARPLSVPITGIGQYTLQMLTEMIKQSPPDWQWLLYSDRPLLIDFSGHKKVQLRISGFSARFLSTIVAQVVYPVWARMDKVDLFWSPRHHLPRLFLHQLSKVVTIHDLVWMRYPETMLGLNRLLEKWLMPPSLRLADSVTSVSTATATDLRKEFPDTGNKLRTIPAAATFISENSNSLPEEPYFLFVGTLEPRKNLLTLLNAFSKLIALGVQSHKLLVAGGQGWGDDLLESRISDLGIESKVELCGYVSEQKLHHLYRHATGLLMPSFYEGFGLPLLEAMQYGTPVITSNCSSLPEVAGEGGILVNPESANEICEAMQRLIMEPDLRSQLSRKAVEQAGNYSWQKSAAMMLELFASFTSASIQ